MKKKGWKGTMSPVRLQLQNMSSNQRVSLHDASHVERRITPTPLPSLHNHPAPICWRFLGWHDMKNHTRFIVCCSLFMFAFRASKAVWHYDGQYIPFHSLAILTRVTGGLTHRELQPFTLNTFRVASLPNLCVFCGTVGRKQGTKEESHAGTERTCKHHTEKAPVSQQAVRRQCWQLNHHVALV